MKMLFRHFDVFFCLHSRLVNNDCTCSNVIVEVIVRLSGSCFACLFKIALKSNSLIKLIVIHFHAFHYICLKLDEKKRETNFSKLVYWTSIMHFVHLRYLIVVFYVAPVHNFCLKPNLFIEKR